MHKRRHIISVGTLVMLTCLSSLIVQDCWARKSSPSVHWVFCIDTSGSMKTRGHMDLLKVITDKIADEFLDANKNIIKAGDRITVFSFDETVRLEATALYQTENDILTIRAKLVEMNKRHGNLTFISEAIVRSVELIEKYSKFFHTNALYIFTDGKSEPYSKKWPKKKQDARKKRDAENLKKISLFGRDHELNAWLGVLKWEAFADAKSFVAKMGKGGHFVDLTDFNRLSLEKALSNFAETVRSGVTLLGVKSVDLGTIPYKGIGPYRKNLSFGIQMDKIDTLPPIIGRINFDPDNPSEIAQEYPLEIRTTEDKMVMNFELAKANELKPGTYRGKLHLVPSQTHFGTLVINPSQLDVEFRKSGYLSFYVWRVVAGVVLGFVFLVYFVGKIKRKIPIKL